MQDSTGLKDIRRPAAVYLQASPFIYRPAQASTGLEDIQASKIRRPAGPLRNIA